jgi:hypothetical protein
MVLGSSVRGNAAGTEVAMEDSMRAQALGTIRKALFAAALLGLAAGLAACKPKAGADEPGASSGSGDESEASEGGDSGPATPNSVVHKSGGKSATARIGPPGGTLSLASGAKVEIPPGTIEGSEEVTIADAPSSTAFLNSEHQRPIGPVFTVAPAMEATEGRTIRVSIPLSAYPQGWGDVQLGYEYPVGEMVGGEDATHTKWQTEPAKLSGGRAVAEVPALPGFRLQFVLSNLESQ